MSSENNKLKEILMILSGVFIIVLIFYFAVKSFNEMDNNVDQKNMISVSGKGEIFVKPDIAEISLSVRKEAISIAEVQKQAGEAINKVVVFLKSSGIEEKDIKTTNYSIYPRYDYLKQGQVFRGYVIDQTLNVKIRKIDEAGNILAGAVSAGANQVGGISFTVDNLEAVQRQARETAIKDAKEKAKQLAEDLGVRMGKLINYSEGNNGVIYSMYDIKSAEPALQIPSGENKVTVNVNLTYEIK